jgi:hypothetical protein
MGIARQNRYFVFVGREFSRHETLEERNKKKEMIVQGKIVKVMKKKRQGTGTHEEFRVDHTLLDAIPEATQVLRDKLFEETSPVSFVFESQQCRTCMDTLNERLIVPTQLEYMHDIMFHYNVDNIISYKYNN